MPANFLEILEQIIDAIGSDDPEQKWVLIGSLGLYLQGVKLVPQDIDILASEPALKSLTKLFKKHLVSGPEYSKTDLFEGIIARFNIEGTKVEIMQDFKINCRGIWEDRNFLLQQHEIIYFQGLAVPTPSLTDTLKALRQLNRPKDQARIPLVEERIKELYK